MDHTGGYVDHTGCHQLVFSTIRPTTGGLPPLPGVSDWLRGTILAAVDWCFDAQQYGPRNQRWYPALPLRLRVRGVAQREHQLVLGLPSVACAVENAKAKYILRTRGFCCFLRLASFTFTSVLGRCTCSVNRDTSVHVEIYPLRTVYSATSWCQSMHEPTG